MEWELFDQVQNIGGRAVCQDNWSTFQIMRSSQLLPWPPELLSSYRDDLLEAKAAGRNPLSEKIRLYDGTHLSGGIPKDPPAAASTRRSKNAAGPN